MVVIFVAGLPDNKTRKIPEVSPDDFKKSGKRISKNLQYRLLLQRSDQQFNAGIDILHIQHFHR